MLICVGIVNNLNTDHEHGLDLWTDTKGLHSKKWEHIKNGCYKGKTYVQMVIHEKQHSVVKQHCSYCGSEWRSSHLSLHTAFNPILFQVSLSKKPWPTVSRWHWDAWDIFSTFIFWCIHVKSFLTLATKELVFFSISVWRSSPPFFYTSTYTFIHCIWPKHSISI